MKKKIIATIIASPANPPTTPPTIGPMLDLDDFFSEFELADDEDEEEDVAAATSVVTVLDPLPVSETVTITVVLAADSVPSEELVVLAGVVDVEKEELVFGPEVDEV